MTTSSTNRGLVEADRKYLFWLLQRQVALGAGPNSKSHNARIDRILSVLQQAPLGDEREAVARLQCLARLSPNAFERALEQCSPARLRADLKAALPSVPEGRK